MSEVIFNPDQRLTRSQRNKEDKKWYKDQLNTLDGISFASSGIFGYDSYSGSISEYRRMQVNYDLFNNVIHKSDFEKVCYPFGKEVGELPVDFTNKDIISGKVKALLGMEMKRPFAWKVVATNKEATTRKESEFFNRIREFVVNSIMLPIKQEIEMQMQQESEGRELTPEEQREIQQRVEEQLKAMTPPEVKRYMERDHQDPAEVLGNQMLKYLIQKQDIEMKFNKVWKHGLISGREILWVGVIAGEPVLKVVNPLRFDYDKTSDSDYIEDSEWAVYEMYMTPSEIVTHFGGELTTTEIDEIYESYSKASSLPDAAFTFRNDGAKTIYGIRVIHGEWKSLKLIKFVTGIDPETGEPYEDMVDESYELNPEAGDIAIAEEWIPTKFEGYKIGEDKFAFLREVPGQHRDLDNLYVCKLSYIGATYDNLNSEVVSIVDRMKFYQYLYNIIWYRIENLIASDDGKQVLLNMNLIPKKAGLDIEKWMYYFKVNKIGLMNPSEEGNKGSTNMGEAAKEIDLSLVSDISKYMELAEYIERRCGEVVGITKQIEGQIGEREGVRNVQQALTQSANILEPYFEVHNNVKRNALQALLETAKVAYAEFQPEYLSFVLDDFSMQVLQMDYELLENSSYSLFVANSMKSFESLQKIEQLSYAALQNQMTELSDVLSIINSDSTQETEEILKASEKERKELEAQAQQREFEARQKEVQDMRAWEKEKIELEHRNKLEEIELKGKYDLQKQTILSIGFNEDKDLDKDGIPDVLEVYTKGVDAEIKQRKQDLDEAKFKQSQKEHEDNVKLKQQEIKSKTIRKEM